MNKNIFSALLVLTLIATPLVSEAGGGFSSSAHSSGSFSSGRSFSSGSSYHSSGGFSGGSVRSTGSLGGGSYRSLGGLPTGSYKSSGTFVSNAINDTFISSVPPVSSHGPSSWTIYHDTTSNNPFSGNFWFWMWMFGRHNSTPTVITNTAILATSTTAVATTTASSTPSGK